VRAAQIGGNVMALVSKVISFEAHGGPHDGGSFVVADHRVIVGSEADCDFVLAEPGVSGEHASLKLLNSHVEVHDLGSSSGTFVNGARIAAPTLVGVGDELRIGSTVLREVVGDGAPERAALAPEDAAAATATAAAAPAAMSGVPPAPAAAPPATSGAPPAPPPSRRRGPGFLRGPHRRRNIGIGAGLLLLVAVVAGIAVLVSGGGGLSMQEVVAKDKPATLMVVSRSRGISPVSGTAGIFAGGSAWVYDAKRGLIVTNAHVLMGGDTFEAGYDGSSLSSATVVGVDARDDIAVLRVAPGNLPGLKALERASSSSTHQGDKVYVLGYPGNATSQTDFLRTPFQPTDGTITATSGVRANVNTDAFGLDNENAALLLSDLYQTTAAINAGASGGPMVNDQGKLVGMNVASGKEAQHYAIPISTLDKVLPQLVQGRSIAWLGIGVSALPPQVASRWNIDGGMVITSVVKDTPAEQAGLADYLAFAMKPPEDFLLLASVNNQRITTMQEYVNVTSQLQTGQKATVVVGRFSPNGLYHGYREFKITVP
jgi:S1-C subfamily serine protease